jgi:hypothetical protein
VGFAAERSDAAQLQRRFVEKRVRVYAPEGAPVPNSGRLLIIRRGRIGKVVSHIGNCARRADGHSGGVKSSAVVGMDRVNVHRGVASLCPGPAGVHHMD